MVTSRSSAPMNFGLSVSLADVSVTSVCLTLHQSTIQSAFILEIIVHELEEGMNKNITTLQ